MDGDNNSISTTYNETVLLFEWMYLIPSSTCLPCPNTFDSILNTFARFNIFTANVTVSGSDDDDDDDVTSTAFGGGDFAMCDVYCSFPFDQRSASAYEYDLEVLV